MIRKRLSPEERRGVLIVAALALILLICGFCHRYGSPGRGINTGYPHEVTVGSPAKDSDGADRDSFGRDGYETKTDRTEKSEKRSRYGKSRKGSGRARRSYPAAERDFLSDTISSVR